MARPGPRRLFAAVGCEVSREAHPLTQGFEEGDFESHPLPRPRPHVQRGKDAGVGVHAASYVGYRDAHLRGRFGGAGYGDEPSLALEKQIVSLLVPVGT